MKKISSVVDKFRIENPTATDSVVIEHLKKLGYSDIEIKKFFYEEIQEFDDNDEEENEEMPDLDDPFDFPEDINDELHG